MAFPKQAQNKQATQLLATAPGAVSTASPDQMERRMLLTLWISRDSGTESQDNAEKLQASKPLFTFLTH